MGKILIAYFSHEGMNYLGGKIVDLPVGNTKKVAEKIAAHTGGELFRIQTVQKYPFEYRDCVEQAKKEAIENARPALVNTLPISEYDSIFLGYPNWCGTMPKAVWTFLESADFSGKRILPFCTHEGSGAGTSMRDISALCRGAKIENPFTVRGGEADSSDEKIEKWLKTVLK